MDTEIDCQDCIFLLHYEQAEVGGKWELPRCSIEFRDGSKINHPCPDKIKDKPRTYKPES